MEETTEATELQRQGTDLWRRLLNEPNRSDKSKKQLALKFAWLQELTVDLAVQSEKLVQAVELAEQSTSPLPYEGRGSKIPLPCERRG
ncbi:hypothetical protein [Nostoc sp.]|uniref:hypothetical protein n=1 Tax=Nostoc sp. TaxID=1180 RepID=UPI002FFB1CE8